MSQVEPIDADPEDGRLSAYRFDLPVDLIAQDPAERRDDSRLLVYRRATGAVEHRRFAAIGEFLGEGDLLVLNETRVAPARLRGRRAATGGKLEALVLEDCGDGTWWALVGTRGRLAADEVLHFPEGASARLVERGERGRWRLRLVDAAGARLEVVDYLERVGEMPLPPYIRRRDVDPERARRDRERYQTTYARRPGAVAAPTAGLHFTPELLDALDARGVQTTRVLLQVGLGTFSPVEVEDLAEHRMHAESFEVSAASADAIARARSRGGRVIAVGTTSVRALESAYSETDGRVVAGSGTTRLFIRPPAILRTVDGMITNFHLPESTLLMLVSAFVGRRRLFELYREAIERRYRFFSYGDAMLLL